MRNIILQDDPVARERLFPFSLTRPIGEIQVGITTLAAKWAHYLGGTVSYGTADYLQEKYPCRLMDDNWFIYSHIISSPGLAISVMALKPGQGLSLKGMVFAWRSQRMPLSEELDLIEYTGELRILEHPYHIFHFNGDLLRQDFQMLTRGRQSAEIAGSNRLLATEHIFLENGAIAEHCYLNATRGPIYLGKGAEVMEGAMIRGPFSMGEGSVVKMGATIYGATSLGPFCRMGGEIKNAVVFGYSNKAHEGYLGDAVIGEWCNLGANTNCSNLKNNVGNVKVWDAYRKTYRSAGTKCGLMMGDYSRSGISTMFNTGTVTGISCNIFGGDFPPKFIPSFSWGGAARWMKYDLEKAIGDARSWMKMKQQEMTGPEEDILKYLFSQTG
ncbi:MAG TPA: putative sugar nucleotidyl transferase [Chitinophagaceae bacterium]|nr:putative sugar nucleotidyl transferase [Chitinophagaceae bacterium]